MADNRSDARGALRGEHEHPAFDGKQTSLLPIQSPAYGAASMPPAYGVPSSTPAYGAASVLRASGVQSRAVASRPPSVPRMYSVPPYVPASPASAAVLEAPRGELNRQLQEATLMQQAAHAYDTARYEQALSLTTVVTGQHAKLAEMTRAITLGQLARYDECLFAFAVYLADNAEDFRGWTSYADFLSTLDQRDLGVRAYRRALELIEVALERAPTDASLWSQKAHALLGLWLPEEALSAALTGLELNERDALLAQHRGRAHLYLAQLQEAKTWLSRAIALDAHDPYAHFYLAKVLAKLGQQSEADRHVAYVQSVSPHLTSLSRSTF